MGAVAGLLGFITSYSVQDIEHDLDLNQHLDRAQDLLRIQPEQTTTYVPVPQPADLLRARREIRDALTIAPESPRARLFEAIHASFTVFAGFDTGSASPVELFERVIDAEPNYLSAYLYYSLHLIEQRRYNEAVDVIERGRERDSQHIDLRVNLGLCQLRLGNHEAGRNVLSALLDDEPGRYPDTVVVPAMVNLIPYLINEGRFDEAEAICERTAELEPDNPEILRHLGVIKAVNRKPEEAELALRRCLQLDPEPEVADVASQNLAQVLFDLGKRTEADQIVERLEAKRRRNALIESALQMKAQ